MRERVRGTLRSFDDTTGIGVLTQDDRSEYVFVYGVHAAALKSLRLVPGDAVRFDVTRGPKGLEAANVRPVPGGAGVPLSPMGGIVGALVFPLMIGKELRRGQPLRGFDLFAVFLMLVSFLAIDFVTVLNWLDGFRSWFPTTMGIFSTWMIVWTARWLIGNLLRR